jgi:uncharacterized phage infection (PIP) family protein YhgE
MTLPAAKNQETGMPYGVRPRKVTPEKVAQACAALGDRVSLRRVRIWLGGGSLQDIQPLVQKWFENAGKISQADTKSFSEPTLDEQTDRVAATSLKQAVAAVHGDVKAVLGFLPRGVERSLREQTETLGRIETSIKELPSMSAMKDVIAEQVKATAELREAVTHVPRNLDVRLRDQSDKLDRLVAAGERQVQDKVVEITKAMQPIERRVGELEKSDASPALHATLQSLAGGFKQLSDRVAELAERSSTQHKDGGLVSEFAELGNRLDESISNHLQHADERQFQLAQRIGKLAAGAGAAAPAIERAIAKLTRSTEKQARLHAQAQTTVLERIEKTLSALLRPQTQRRKKRSVAAPKRTKKKSPAKSAASRKRLVAKSKRSVSKTKRTPRRPSKSPIRRSGSAGVRPQSSPKNTRRKLGRKRST